LPGTDRGTKNFPAAGSRREPWSAWSSCSRAAAQKKGEIRVGMGHLQGRIRSLCWGNRVAWHLRPPSRSALNCCQTSWGCRWWCYPTCPPAHTGWVRGAESFNPEKPDLQTLVKCRGHLFHGGSFIQEFGFWPKDAPASPSL